MSKTQPETAPHQDAASTLIERFRARTATVAVVGLGYVGLPLCRALHECGMIVLGYDNDESKITRLGRGENYLKHLGAGFAEHLAESDRFSATADPDRLAEADAVVLCVPTPLGAHREPDLRFVLDSTRMVARTLRAGQLVVLESTTYPGTTRDEVTPILEHTGLRCGTDFFVAYSPEREDPGRPGATASTIPKLVGGVDEVSTDVAMAMYEQAVEHVHRVATAEVAEAAKLLENIYRAVNIALVNEMKVLLSELDIDVWDVIDAASTKPFGFQPFFPGPGLGGHCIPIDPFYMSWKAKEIGRSTKFIELAGEINAHMPSYVITRMAAALNERATPVRGAKILLIGIAYKPNVDDIRESPAAEIVELLRAQGAEIAYHDPHVPTFPPMRRYRIELASQPLTPALLAAQDCVLIVTDHDAVDYELIGREAALVVDTRNAMAAVAAPKARIVKA